MIKKAAELYRQSFTGLSTETWILSIIMLVNRSGTMVLPFMTLYLTGKDMNRTLSEAGTVVGLWGLGAMIGAYFGGKLTDKIGYYKVQFMALAFGGISFILLGYMNSYPLICLFTFVLSMINESFRPANSTAVAAYSTVENRTRSYSLNRLAINLGWAVGVSIGGFVASYSYKALFWIDGCTNILAAFAMVVFLKPKFSASGNTPKENPDKATISVYKDRPFMAFVFLTMLFGLCFFQLFSTVPNYFRDQMHLSEKFIGSIMAVNGLLIVLIEMVLVNYLEGKKHILVYITFGTLLCAIAFLCLLLPCRLTLIASSMILLISFVEIAAMPFMNTYWSLRSTDSNRGQYAALITIAWSAGQTVGPYASSLIAEKMGFPVMFIGIALVLTITAAGFHWLKIKEG